MLLNSQPFINPLHLLDIQINGKLIGVLNQNQKRIQLLRWNGWFVEIDCQYQHPHWIPVRLTYRLLTPNYQALLEQSLPPDQLKSLRLVLLPYPLN